MIRCEEDGFWYKDENIKYEDFAKINRQIFMSLADQESKDIYQNRLMFSLTDDTSFMRKVILSTQVGKKLFECLKKLGGGIYIWSW